MDKNLWINLQFVGFSLNYTYLTPNPYPTNNVRRVYPEFFESFNIVQDLGSCPKTARIVEMLDDSTGHILQITSRA